MGHKKEATIFGIACVIGAIIIGIVTIILASADGQVAVYLGIAAVTGLTILGSVLGYFTSQIDKK